MKITIEEVEHVAELARLEVDADEKQQALPYKIRRLWHNSFDDTIGLDDDIAVSSLATMMASDRRNCLLSLHFREKS